MFVVVVVVLFQCLTPSELLRLHGMDPNESLSQKDFISLCPSLIHEIERRICVRTEKEEVHNEHLEEEALEWQGNHVIKL